MKRIYTILIAVLLTASVFAQAPEMMSYQAVIRDASNQLVTSQGIGMQISILQTTSTGTAVYVETHNTTTNANGLVTVEIGTGTVVSGDFSTIDWSADNYFIKTETDPTTAGGTTYTVTGTSQLMSVAYALHAKTVETVTETDPIFNSSIASGITGTDTTNWNNKLDFEVDADTTNELQVLSFINDTLYLSQGNYIVLPYDISIWQKNEDTIYYNNGNVAIGTTSPSPNAILDINSTTKGVKLTSMTTSQREAILPVLSDIGLMIYDTDTNGFWFWSGTKWIKIATGSGNSHCYTSDGF